MHKLLIYYLTYEYIVLFHEVKLFHLITDIDYNNICDASIHLVRKSCMVDPAEYGAD